MGTSKRITVRERSRCLSNPSERVARILGKHYYALRNELDIDILIERNYNGRTIEDIFSDTILYIIHYKEARELNEEEIIKLFKYRYNMIRYQTVMDAVNKRLDYGKNI